MVEVEVEGLLNEVPSQPCAKPDWGELSYGPHRLQTTNSWEKKESQYYGVRTNQQTGQTGMRVFLASISE